MSFHSILQSEGRISVRNDFDKLNQHTNKNKFIEHSGKSMSSDDNCLDYHKFIEKINIIKLEISNYKKDINALDRETLFKISNILDELIYTIYS